MKRSVSLESMLERESVRSRSVENIRRSGEVLGIRPDTVESLINPQDVHVFRLHADLFGEPTSVWGCTSFHNKARGIYKGGIRISPDVNVWETIELSRLMTLKTALTEIELGGAKTGINFDMRAAYARFGRSGYDHDFERSIKRSIIKEYAHHYRGMLEKKRYVPAPDLGTGPEEMLAIYDETHEPSSVTGKPEGVPGWLPGRAEATGYGVSVVVRRLIDESKWRPQDATVAVHGFGNVGAHAANFLHEHGVKIVAAYDLGGGIANASGLDIPGLAAHARSRGSVAGFDSAISQSDFFKLPVDYLIPAAVNDSISEEIALTLGAKCIVEGANFPVTLSARDVLENRGITVVPDILANAGGVIASGEEFLHAVSTTKIKPEEVRSVIAEKIGANLDIAVDYARRSGTCLDVACTMVAVERVHHTMRQQGWM
jgi:glutamate dehydrogenase/leucine dehydrogenase